MIIVDKALAARAAAGTPIRVGVVGAGYAGRSFVHQVFTSVPGIKIVAIGNRTLEKARESYRLAGIESVEVVETVNALEDAIARGRYAITDNALLLAQAGNIDVIVEITGTIEHGSRVVFEAIRHRKHVVLSNAELDGTVGPILKVHADRAGVIYTAGDGDQPAAELNLARYVKGIGLTPLVYGNIKGLEDHYRTPTTQAAFAEKWKQSTQMVTSFADGSKISFEQATTANAAGARTPKRGMNGFPVSGLIDEALSLWNAEELLASGPIIDYVIGAKPGPGIFVFATTDDPRKRFDLMMYKLGEGPLYSFYTPFHLCHLELPMTIGRAALFHEAALAPLGAPMVDVIALAKRDMWQGETLDAYGGYTTYGQCENYDVVRAQNLLPIGLAEGCRLKRDVPRDHALTYDDVELPPGRLCDELRAEQNAYFAPVAAPTTVATA